MPNNKKQSIDNVPTKELKALEPKEQEKECTTCSGNGKITIDQQVIDCPVCTKSDKDKDE